MPTPTHSYRIVRVADPRSRGACCWYEIEGIAASGARWHVATCDDRHEARELVRSIEADDARRAAITGTDRLSNARREAERLQGQRRTIAANAGAAEWPRFRDAAIFAGGIAANRNHVAAELRAARAEARQTADDARRALAAARAAAGAVNDRRLSAGRLPPDAVARLRALSPSLVADRLAIAQAIRAARSALRRFSA